MEKFDQKKYINDWKKENMATVRASYKKEFVDKFKNACKILGFTQSETIREKMEETIMKADKLTNYVKELKDKYENIIIKLYDYIGLELTDERLINDVHHDFLTENEGRDDNLYLWYFDGNIDYAINIKNGEIVDSEKTEDLFA